MPATPKSGPEPTPTVSLDRNLPAELRAAERTVRDIMQALRAAACNCGDLDEVQLALGEALANAVRHGCRLNARKRISVQCRYHPAEGLWLVVRDPGAGFAPENIPDPTQPENLEKFGGRGIYLIRQLMDEVEFRDAGREIHMRRRPRPPAKAEQPRAGR